MVDPREPNHNRFTDVISDCCPCVWISFNIPEKSGLIRNRFSCVPRLPRFCISFYISESGAESAGAKSVSRISRYRPDSHLSGGCSRYVIRGIGCTSRYHRCNQFVFVRGTTIPSSRTRQRHLELTPNLESPGVCPSLDFI